MQSYTPGIGKRVRAIREKLGLTVGQFGERIKADPKMIEIIIIEGEGLEHDGNALRILERIASVAGEPLEALLFQETQLFTLQVTTLKLEAFRIMRDFEMTNSVAVVQDVFDQIDQEFELAIAESCAVGRDYRQGGTGTLRIDENKVHEMVIKAKRRFQ